MGDLKRMKREYYEARASDADCCHVLTRDERYITALESALAEAHEEFDAAMENAAGCNEDMREHLRARRKAERERDEAQVKLVASENDVKEMASRLHEMEQDLTRLREERDAARNERDLFRIENERLKVLISELGG